MKAWITKDSEGRITLFSKKPVKGYYEWFSLGYNYPLTELPQGINPQWEDEEPIEVELIIKANNKEE